MFKPVLLSGLLTLSATCFAANTYTVMPQPVTQTLYYSGTISPIKNVPVISPTQGVVNQVHFSYGQIVKKGSPLIHVQATKVLDQLRTARVAYLGALEKYNKVQHWKSSNDVINAENAKLRAKNQLDEAQNTYQQNQKLYKLQIISKQALQQSQLAFQNAQMSASQSSRAYQDVLQRGEGGQFTIAKLQYLNAKEKYDSLQQQVNHKTILAPATGIVLMPVSNSQSNDNNNSHQLSGKVVVGTTIGYQQVLMNIGNLDGLRITFSVPQVNINSIKPGQKATITGSGFPGIMLHGAVAEVGAQAKNAGEGLPSFPVIVDVPHITDTQRHLIRSGMNAQVALTVYKQEKQLTVPVNAVRQNKKGQSVVTVISKGKSHDVVITTGKVMANSVQVLSGLHVGQVIQLPSASK